MKILMFRCPAFQCHFVGAADHPQPLANQIQARRGRLHTHFPDSVRFVDDPRDALQHGVADALFPEQCVERAKPTMVRKPCSRHVKGLGSLGKIRCLANV